MEIFRCFGVGKYGILKVPTLQVLFSGLLSIAALPGNCFSDVNVSRSYPEMHTGQSKLKYRIGPIDAFQNTC